MEGSERLDGGPEAMRIISPRPSSLPPRPLMIMIGFFLLLLAAHGLSKNPKRRNITPIRKKDTRGFAIVPLVNESDQVRYKLLCGWVTCQYL